jgi:hypothetical protein
MFISNFEKARIEARLKVLEERIEQLVRSVNALHDIRAMAAAPNVKAIKKLKPNKVVWTDKKRSEQSARMKQRWAEKKAAAQLATAH